MHLNFWKKEPVVFEPLTNASEPEVMGIAPSEVILVANDTTEGSPETNIYNKISGWLVSACVLLLPLFFLPLTTGQLEINKQLLLIIAIGVALVFWLIGVVTSGYLHWRRNSFLLPIGVLCAATLLASIFSISQYRSFYGLANSLSDSFISILMLSVLYVLIINIYDDRGKKLQILLAMSLSLAFLLSILQFFKIDVIHFVSARTLVSNTIGSPNSVGILAAISLPFLIKLRINLPFVKHHWAKVGVVMAILILVIINWWILWVVAIAGMFALVALGSLNSRRFKMSRFLLPLIIIVCGVFLMVVKLDLSLIKKNIPAEVSPSYSLSMRIANSVLKDKFISGYGPENFSIAFDRFGSDVLSNTTLTDAKFYDSSSEFFNFVVQGGVVSGAAVVFFVAYVAWGIFKPRKRDVAQDELDDGIMATTVAMLTALFIYPFNMSLMFVSYVVVGLAALNIWGNRKMYFSIEKSPFLSLLSSLGFIVGLILVLIVSYFGFLFYISDFKYALALSESDNQKKADILAEAVRYNQYNDVYYRALSQVALNLLSSEINKPKDNPQRGAKIQNYVVSSIDFAKKATELQPYEFLNWFNLGLVYRNLLSLVDNVDKLAEDTFKKAAELRPGDASPHYQIGSLYMNEGDLLLQVAASNSSSSAKAREGAIVAYSKAETALKKAVDVSSNFGLAIYSLGVVYEREGKLNDSIKQLEKIAPFNSNQPGLMFELGLLYYRAGRKDDAVSQLQRAIFLAPDYANAHWYLSLIYEEKDDIPSAIDQLNKILSVEVNKENPTVTAKLNQLKTGKKTVPPIKVIDQKPLQ